MAEVPAISSAILTIFAWIVPHVGIEIAEFCSTIKKEWLGDKLAAGFRTITAHSIIAIGVGLLVIAATSTAVALSTKDLDERMLSILRGLSRIVAAIFIFSVSYKVPKWLGVYSSMKRERGVPAGSSLRSLAFHVRWSIYRQMGKPFFLLMPFYGGVEPMTIPVSMVIGLAGGALIGVCVFLGLNCCQRHEIFVSMSLALLFALLSSIAFSSGCYYIGTVWENNVFGSENVLVLVSFFVWLFCIMIIHSFMLKINALKLKRTWPHQKSHAAALSVVSPATAMAEDKPSLFDAAEKAAGDNEHEYVEAVIEDAVPKKTINDGKGEDDQIDPTYCALVRAKLCWCGGNYDNRPPSSVCDHILSAFKWLVWMAASAFFLYITIVNIGVSVQQQPVNEQLSSVETTSYWNMNAGPVCAFDDKGADSTIKTFDSMESANANGFLVLHCGACGSCSTWENLRANWQARKELAGLALQCAQKTLLVGGYGEAVHCHRETIGFDEACSACWVENEICARNNCAFVYLQSDLINGMANFEVGPNAVTSASCDEALCASTFLPCAGANRRRMNIESDMERPDELQCQIVQVDWESLFES